MNAVPSSSLHIPVWLHCRRLFFQAKSKIDRQRCFSAYTSCICSQVSVCIEGLCEPGCICHVYYLLLCGCLLCRREIRRVCLNFCAGTLFFFSFVPVTLSCFCNIPKLTLPPHTQTHTHTHLSIPFSSPPVIFPYSVVPVIQLAVALDSSAACGFCYCMHMQFHYRCSPLTESSALCGSLLVLNISGDSLVWWLWCRMLQCFPSRCLFCLNIPVFLCSFIVMNTFMV